MTKEKIIEMICATWIKDENGIPFILDYNAIADTLLTKIEQEKKEMAKEILKDLYDEAISQQGEIVELTAYYIKNTLAKEYGVEL